MKRSPVQRLAAFQGGYYLVSGFWPIVDGASFQMVTGQKEDFWLAQTVGLLLGLFGFVLLVSSARRSLPAEAALTATLYAAGLTVVDLLCLQNPHTTWAYLVDAPIQLTLAVAWGWTYWRRRGANR